MENPRKPILALPCKMSHLNMKQTNEGYHCVNCDKTLVDFRGQSTDQIFQAIQDHLGKACGILEVDQFVYKESNVLIRPFQNIGLSLLGILGFLGPVVLTSGCSNEPTAKEVKEKAFNNLKFPMHLKGTVRDEDSKEALADSKLQLQQNGKTIKEFSTDKNGNFDILIEKGDLLQEDFTLILGHDYFTNDTVPMNAVSYSQTKQKIALTLKAEPKSCTDAKLGGLAEQKEVQVEGEVIMSGDVIEPYPQPPLAGVPIQNITKDPEPLKEKE